MLMLLLYGSDFLVCHKGLLLNYSICDSCVLLCMNHSYNCYSCSDVSRVCSRFGSGWGGCAATIDDGHNEGC